MKSLYVRDLAPEQELHTIFLVQAKEVRQKRSGEPYLSLTLSDRTGLLDAKMWDNAGPVAEIFDKDDFVKVKGVVQVFQNRPQLTIHKLQRAAETEVDIADFLPASDRDPMEMFRELHQLVASMANPHLKALLAAIFADQEIAKAFRTAPAAKSVHHAYIGGLIEHVLSMAALAKVTAAHYPGIDPDLLLAGVILHDLGKIRELSYERTFGYSTEGQLLGHMHIVLRIIGDKIRAVPGFPPKLRTLLEHMILSHHGTLEFGSPRMPMFAEAMLLHLLDNLDAKMNVVLRQTRHDDRVEGEWTGYVPSLERSLLKKDRYIEEPPADSPRTGASPASASVLAEKLSQALTGTTATTKDRN